MFRGAAQELLPSTLPLAGRTFAFARYAANHQLRRVARVRTVPMTEQARVSGDRLQAAVRVIGSHRKLKLMVKLPGMSEIPLWKFAQ